MGALSATLVIVCAVYLQIVGPVGPFGGEAAARAFKAIATIETIDDVTRTLTVRVKDGDRHILHAGPKVKRFDQLKVGETRTFKWIAPVVYAIHRTDEVVPRSTNEKPARADSTGHEPDGTPPELQTTTVTVRTIDQQIPWVTVERDDGTTMSFWVERKILANVNAGDRVMVRYKVGEVIGFK